jgi:DNA-binding transcriptional LysR family regulator
VSCSPSMAQPRIMEPVKLSAIDANLLLALHALLQERSVTRAGKRLGTGQPAMSRSLARLRDHFDDPLLVAKGRELILSPTAQRLVPAVERAALALTEVFDHRRGGAQARGRTFVLASADLFAQAVVPKVLERLWRESPQSGIELRPIASRSSEQILGDGVDLALGSFEDVPASVNQRELFSDPFVCVLREGHPRVRATLPLKTYVELAHLEVLPTPQARPGLRIERALAAKGLQRRVVARVPYFALASHLLAHTDMVLTMTRQWAQFIQEGTALRVVDVPVKLPPQRFSLIWSRRDDSDRTHAWFRDLVARVCTERFGAH